MPHLTPDLPQGLMTFFTRAVSAFLLVSIFFILQYIFDMDFKCSCRTGVHPNTVVFIIVPPLVLAWFVNITESIHKRKVFLRWCFRPRNSLLCYLFKFILDYISLGVVWSSAVLFDGDWYLCLRTNLNANQTGIPCRNNLTYEEEVIKAGYKADSLDIGLVIIGSFAVLWFIGELIHFGCVRSKECCECCCAKLKPRPYYRLVYEELLDEQVRVRLKDELFKIAKERAEAICEPHLQEIRTHELNQDSSHGENSGDDTTLDTWWTISAPDLHPTDLRPQKTLLGRSWTVLRNLWPYD